MTFERYMLYTLYIHQFSTRMLQYFFQFCLQIWNQCKSLSFLVPILTYLKKKVFCSVL